MNTDARASWAEATPPARARRLLDLTGPVRRLPQRFRERRFWAVQALVLGITALHWELEATEVLGEHEALSFVPVSFYFIPIVYAGLNFGMEGALPTALWSAALALPNVFVWHAGLQRLGEFVQLAIMISVAILVARRVDLETKQRLRAEKTSASLRLLNEVGEILSHTLEVEQQVPRLLRRLLSGLSLESAWLSLRPDAGDSDSITIETRDQRSHPPAELLERLNALVMPMEGPLVLDRQTTAIPLIGEAGPLGFLGATVPSGQTLADENIHLLTTVAHEVRVALENARLYRQRQEGLQSYARQVTQAQEEERLRIARELHDEMAQELVHAVRRLERLRHSVDPTLVGSIDELLDRTRNLVQAVRRYSRDLRPSVLDDLGLLAAIEMVVDDINDRLPGGARLEVAGKPRRLDGPVELALFRIAQEALRNVEKHADATTAVVGLDFGAEEIRLSVSDDGVGFAPPGDVADLSGAGKLGLLGMKERAELVGGRFDLCSSPGRGTQIAVVVKQTGTAQA